MDNKEEPIKKSNSNRIFRLLPVFGIVICLFIILIIVLLSVAEIDKTVSAEGFFEPYPRSEIKAAVKDTTVDNVLVLEGQAVKEGEVLMLLKDRENICEKIAQLKERIKLADIDVDRLSRLSDKGYIAVKDKQEAELRMRMLAQDLKALRIKKDSLVITAPFSAMVIGIPVKSGDAVSLGQTLICLAGSGERALRILIKENSSSEIETGQKVRVYSRVFYYRRHGIALGEIVQVNRYPITENEENYIEAIAKIIEAPFPVRVNSRADAKIIIKRCPVLKLLLGLER